MRLAIDMASIMKTCLFGGKDVEGYTVQFEGKAVHVNKALYGYEHAINHIVGTLLNWNLAPKDLILVFEGFSTKAPRLAISGEYKARRKRSPDEVNFEVEELQELLIKALNPMGATCLTQDYAEGDDTLGWLAENMEDNLVIDSYDNDLSVLNTERNKYGAKVQVTIDGAVGENKYGQFDCKYITVYKALVGDTSDGISGVRGFGKESFKELFALIGEKGLAELDRMAQHGNVYDLADELHVPIVKRVFDGNDDFIKSYALAKIHPEWVNTCDYPLQFKAGLIRGKVTDERLARWKPTISLVTNNIWEKFFAWALPKLMESQFIALDIEASTPDETDEWLLAQDAEDKVDTIGAELAGMSLTFGNNLQHTVYISVDHKDTDNVPVATLLELILELQAAEKKLVIHNFAYEGPVLYQLWREPLADNGFEGFLGHVLDTKMEASYVNENEPLGLKKLSKMYFDYNQTEYSTVVTIDNVVHKMRDLTGAHVLGYGADDTIVTASLHNFFKLFMELEHTYQVYLNVEIDAMYQHTQSFTHGTKCDVAKLKELAAIDDVTYAEASATLDAYLVSKNWPGCTPPQVTEALSSAEIKAAFLVVQGKELNTRVRNLDKLIEEVKEQGGVLLASLLAENNIAAINNLVASKFVGKPELNIGSPTQLQKLFYTTMGLPIRVFNKPTDVMKAKGIRQGSPKTDALAMAYAEAMDATAETKTALTALKLMRMVGTRRGLYYNTYPYFVHWKTGRIHSGHNQCATNTRRASSSSPNFQQMPKHPKIEGQPSRFREVIVPHKRRAVIVSMDFMAQELRVIADYSRDQNMLDCFVGDNLKDMHALTGLGVISKKEPAIEWNYELYMQILGDREHPMFKAVKESRALGKKVNFTTEFGAKAPKLALTLLCSETEAQAYIDAKEHTFIQVVDWKTKVVAEAKLKGYVTTKLGARRHLRDLFRSRNGHIASKAERQAVNFKVQSSSGEMTKLAEGRMWKARLEKRFDCQIIGPIHDEVVASCTIDDLHAFIPAMHACMVVNYADMTVPIKSSISFGRNFGEQIEIGEEPTKEAIDKGLADLAEIIAKEEAALAVTSSPT